MRFLVTAFEPFGKYPYNPSAALLELLSQKSGKAKNANQAEKNIKSEIIPVLLPTSYSRAAKILSESIDKYHPDCAVLLGLAGGRKAVSLEFVALNIKAADIPDNDGELADGESVIPNKRNALFTTLPLGKMASSVNTVTYRAMFHIMRAHMYVTVHISICFAAAFPDALSIFRLMKDRLKTLRPKLPSFRLTTALRR